MELFLKFTVLLLSCCQVLLMVIRVLGILCVGVAHQSNRSTQLEIANSDAFVTLVQLLRTSRISLIQVSRFSAFVHLFVCLLVLKEKIYISSKNFTSK